MDPTIRRAVSRGLSRLYDVNDVHSMLDVPSDAGMTTEEESDLDHDYDSAGDDPEYNPVEDEPVHDGFGDTESEPEEPDIMAPSTSGTSDNTSAAGMAKKSTSSAKSTSQKDVGKIAAQVQAIEKFLAKQGSNTITTTQIKSLQASLSQLGKGPKETVTAAKIKSLLEIAKRGWKKRETPLIVHNFRLQEGPKLEKFVDCTTPGDVFLKFLDDPVVEDIIFQSNLYTNEKMRNIPPITKVEFYAFLGINMVMGYHQLPSYTDYWRSDQDLSVPFVSSALTRNRFSQILTNLHVNNNADIPDKLYKIRPLINAMNNNYVKLNNVSRKLSIIQGPTLHQIVQSMKPIKRGYKLWVRADMDGYISKFDIYQGKGGTVGQTENMDDSHDGAVEFGLGEKIVQDLTKDLFEKHHHVYFDNYFSSIPLMEYLKANAVDAFGTIRSNRKALPVDMLADRDLLRGDCDFRVSNQDIAFYKWRDNKAVYAVSNFNGTDLTTVLRTQKDGSRKEFPCPAAIKEYNEYMGGVDKADMLWSVHGLDRKSKKWWHRIFFCIIDGTLVNAQVTYSKLQERSITTLDFRRSVAQTMITRARQPRVGRPAVSSPPQVGKKRRRNDYSVPASIRVENRGAHWVIYGEIRGRCEVCQRNEDESRPYSQCSMCKVHLCSNRKKNCFNTFYDVE